nr:MAG TPA: hypothetical protein [Caudoviricetes sp.]
MGVVDCVQLPSPHRHHPPPPPVPYGGLNNRALKHNAPLNNRRFNNGTLISSLQFLNAFLYISLKKRYINVHQK